MSMSPYRNNGPVDLGISVNFDDALATKSVIVTGGASGLGRAYAVAFAKAGAFVTIADYDKRAGQQTASELAGAQFVKCDVRQWEDQVAVFEAAVKNSPAKSCDIVIADAGVVESDDLFNTEDPFQPPVKPDLRIIEINLLGMAYTAKLAMHYFRRQPTESSRDRCLILKGSIAAYADQLGSPQYNASKWGSRGLMRSLRRVTWKDGVRANLVAPWYVRTPILSDKVVDFLQGKGVKFATIDDCARNYASDRFQQACEWKGIWRCAKRRSTFGVYGFGP